MTLADVIETFSEYSVGSEETDDISDAQLSILQAGTSDRVTRLNPGFIGNELSLFTAYIILDAWENRPGTGPITEKTVKDTRWKVKDPSNSSSWLDLAYRMIAEYKSTQNTTLSVSGVARCDSKMKGLDSTEVTQWGDLSGSL